MKKTARWMGSIVVFVVLGLFLFGTISEVLRRKTAGESDMVHSFYEVEKDSLDVLFLGSSHLYYGVQPNELWREYGMTSYVLGSPEQTAATSYFLLKEAFRYQKPKVVALESYYLWFDGLYNSEARLRQAFDGMRFGRTKLEMIQELLGGEGPGTKLSYCLPFLKYHGRWNVLENYDFHTKPYLKGARIDYTAVPVEDPGLPETPSRIPEVNLEYLEKMQELCEENGAKLVVFAIPYGAEEKEGRYEKRQGTNLTLEDWLEERDIPFAFYQKQQPELIDFAADFRDRTHLNTAGAEKMTFEIGRWLSGTYALTDHRGDPEFASWDEDLAKYDRDAAAQRENPEDTADPVE